MAPEYTTAIPAATVRVPPLTELVYVALPLRFKVRVQVPARERVVGPLGGGMITWAKAEGAAKRAAARRVQKVKSLGFFI
jgi:hypothetical protein